MVARGPHRARRQPGGRGARAEADLGQPLALCDLGVGFGLLAIAFLVYGSYRHQAVDAALRRGEFAPLDRRVVLVLGAFGVVLGLLTILAVLIEV